ncbi:PilZ domain-containing protein [Caldichromatium japonicum]|uniref:PilZ domain-containing protein n=1 Tax=Caldichromatium japonicum TaxID=2699430 RepID=A0A6G7V9W6_9GAMM|nr:PilZ domain-containing protein [Caldichromatium japonicum]QIK36700.1 PilZ domain-containing protein [Caldichromatium japonicum]
MPAEETQSSFERRAQARLHVQLPVQLQCKGEEQPRRAVLLDLSWGGALCQTKGMLPTNNQLVQLWLPWEQQDRIQIEAQLLRQKPGGGGQCLVALRFRRLSLTDHNRLERLLGRIREQDAANRTLEPQPLAAMIEVMIKTFDEWRAALVNIASGRLLISTPAAFMPGQSLGLRFNGVPQRARLNLRARVLTSEPKQNPDGTSAYLLTVEFEHLESALRNWTQWLLAQIPDEKGPLPSDYQYPPAVAIPAQIILAKDTRSALELGFPEAMNYLITAWGDAEAFDIVFRQLIFGESFTTETWTPEAWEELKFLQSLHEEAYGVSEGRRLMLRITGQEPF